MCCMSKKLPGTPVEETDDAPQFTHPEGSHNDLGTLFIIRMWTTPAIANIWAEVWQAMIYKRHAGGVGTGQSKAPGQHVLHKTYQRCEEYCFSCKYTHCEQSTWGIYHILCVRSQLHPSVCQYASGIVRRRVRSAAHMHQCLNWTWPPTGRDRQCR